MNLFIFFVYQFDIMKIMFLSLNSIVLLKELDYKKKNTFYVGKLLLLLLLF